MIGTECLAAVPDRLLHARTGPGEIQIAWCVQRQEMTCVVIVCSSGAEEVGDATFHRGVGAVEDAAELGDVAPGAGVLAHQ